MSLQEALSKGVSVTGVGLLIVFAVLVILMLVMIVMKMIFYKEPEKASVQSVPTYEQADAEDEEELIAVLTAAVAASLSTSTYNLKIKSYRRITDSAPAWNRAGVGETINNRL